ncbi:nucleotidyltransferase domain-containing protein [Pseudomonas akapageensis]|uniref:nucleotidyltransferase domain-containing protein n=1 Tax=Pseudomonas akapageensis TaxID=2609961 RepID=UPI00140A851C|nr:nucleotidyltransferase domain-containing protein [Pseudomonas akapageensis]
MPPLIFPQHPYLEERYRHSETLIQFIRARLASATSRDRLHHSMALVITGSFGRHEASPSSDIDFFLLHDSEKLDRPMIQVIELLEREIAPHTLASDNDAQKFSLTAISRFSDIIGHIGGKQDTYVALTRRMLLLLEGDWLFGEVAFQNYRRHLLENYIKVDDSDRCISRYLLNEVVRYYRTLMTNFDHQVSVQNKPWGLRNIKLHFSRKLLFLSGIVAIAETTTMPRLEKIDRLCALFSLPPLQRLETLGRTNPLTTRLLDLYECFLKAISSTVNRLKLDGTTRHSRLECSLYCELRNQGESFSQTLEEWLRLQYPGHPIHHALLF